MKKTVTLLVTLLFVFNTFVARAYRYAPPYTQIDGGRAEENMPAPFSFESATKKLVAEDNFDSETANVHLERPSLSGQKSYDDGTIKFNKNQNNSPLETCLTYTGELYEGETYAFRCRIRTENLSGGAPRSIIQVYGKKGWIKETSGYGGKGEVTGTNDWYEMVQFIQIPDGATSLRLTVRMEAGVTGVVCFDDFELYRIVVDPLEAVLLKPNYKGLIYGDGNADIELDVTVGERTDLFNLSDMEISVRLVSENGTVYRYSEAENISEKMNFVYSSKGLSEGDYYLQTVLSDKESGEIISEKEQTIRKRSKTDKPDTYLDENGRIIRNGEKVFLKRIMNSGGNYLEVAESANAAGIDTISHYGMWWAVDDSNMPKAALSYMRENDMRSSISLAGYEWSSLSGNGAKDFIKKQSDLLPFLSKVAQDYKNDSVLDGYYLFDEPDPVISGEEIRWNNEILAQADIDHPTYGVADKGYEYYGIYTKMADILGVDPYPVTGKTDNSGISVDDISLVGDSVREAKANFPNRPIYVVLQGFNWISRGDLRGPNESELKNMAWQAICEGADGLDWYSYSSMINDTVETKEQWLQKLNNVFLEVAEYEDIILSDAPVPNFRVTGGGDWLNITLRRYNGKTYLFAVNNTYRDKSATVNIDGAPTQNLTFEPLEVKKVQIAQSDFLSPEAELKTMGFSNGNNGFAVYEDDGEYVLCVPRESGVINYCAEISDGAKLYIGTEERHINGMITLKIVEKFKVTVVAENGIDKTERIYRVVKE